MNEIATSGGLFDRTIRRIGSLWWDRASSQPGDAVQSIEQQMRACLEGRGGEVSARNRAAGLAETYLSLDEPGRIEFLRTLAGFDSNPEIVAAAIAAMQAETDPAGRAAAKAGLRRALEAPRLRLLSQFSSIPEGIKFLVDMRALLLTKTRDDKQLAALDSDLRGLMANWFDLGFLDLHRIDWSSPASLLEKLVAYEAVHAIRSWTDLKNRLDSDRRCYAFFHPRMPGEPLIFVEVALVTGLAGSVQTLLDEDAPLLDPHAADTAIFYSISNCQRGLAGISFGNFLIKRVAELLSAEFRNINTFATLSPIPGFRSWLDQTLQAEQVTTAASNEGKAPLLSEEETEVLLAAVPDAATGAAALVSIVEQRGWFDRPDLLMAADPVLNRLCAGYLLTASAGKRARDPVAHFHLSNGASIERINLLGDTSDKGNRESATLMVNYLYDLQKIEDWHEDYAGEGKRNASVAVRRLARGWV
jgi:malonyl-CoA decarboxylase